MEADWEFEIGGGAPVIEAWWPGFVDLRRNLASIADIPEAVEVPALGDVLIRLNGHSSPVWTTGRYCTPTSSTGPGSQPLRLAWKAGARTRRRSIPTNAVLARGSKPRGSPRAASCRPFKPSKRFIGSFTTWQRRFTARRTGIATWRGWLVCNSSTAYRINS